MKTTKTQENKKCEKCGRVLPIDTPRSVYACTVGSGCSKVSTNK